jgi:NitT/TauT family transport system ATP-binding protein
MQSDDSRIRLEHVSKRFPSGLHALEDVNLKVAAGEFVSLLGPSGCGKSTVLRLVAGLDLPSSGRVDAPALRREAAATTAFVFQDPTLMPWASVFDNVYLPLRLAGRTRKEVAGPVADVLALVGLDDFARSFPSELSGGMRMRASIARALVTQPQVLLMDEPFAALDEVTRNRLNLDLLAWWSARPLSVLFVTHSVFEAAFLSQRVLVMGVRPGHVVTELRIEQPYPRVASFRGSTVFQQACRELSAAIESVQQGAPA